MILSMTGYGKGVATLNGEKISIELKSLNSKSMDVSARVNSLFREKEIEIRSMAAKALVRGKVEINVTLEKDSAVATAPLNTELARSYYTTLKQLSDTLACPEPTDWVTLLSRIPGVLAQSDQASLTAEQWSVAQKALQAALIQITDFRRQEGAALEQTLRTKIANIRSLQMQVTPFEEARVQKVRTRLFESLEKLGIDYDKNRLEQELIYYIEKLDISEEKQRLTNHLDYFLQTLDEESEQGKKLGFIAQEIGREVNTLGSKSNQAEMQNIVVQMKDELEQIKEQVLNIL